MRRMPRNKKRPRFFIRRALNKFFSLAGLSVHFPLIEFYFLTGCLIKVKSRIRVEVQGAVVTEENIVEPVAVRSFRNFPVAIAAVEMPFADITGAVAVVAQDFGEILPVSGKHAKVVIERAVLEVVLPAEQHGSHRSANRV